VRAHRWLMDAAVEPAAIFSSPRLAPPECADRTCPTGRRHSILAATARQARSTLEASASRGADIVKRTEADAPIRNLLCAGRERALNASGCGVAGTRCIHRRGAAGARNQRDFAGAMGGGCQRSARLRISCYLETALLAGRRRNGTGPPRTVAQLCRGTT